MGIMQALFKNILRQECDKHVERHFDYLYQLDEDIRRKSDRLGVPVAKNIERPPYWEIDERFNPFKVRAKRNIEKYSYTIARKVRGKTYEPSTAVSRTVPKEDGGQRDICVFQLPDSALSRLVYKSLLNKNVNKFSAYAYAYREDKSAHDAVMNIFSEWRNLNRVYVAEFDFSKFFDNIQHEYIWDVLKRQGFLYTEEERFIIHRFLSCKHASLTQYDPQGGEVRNRGIPQGTSISLFLANAVCCEFDRELERLGVGFARYADDTLIWSHSYDKIVQAYEIINNQATRMGVPINLEKSEGITLVTTPRHKDPEMKTKHSVAYLGYQISLDKISIAQKRLEEIKAKISYLIYQNLIQPLRNGTYNQSRLAGIDWDYVVVLYQVRRYLYGGLDSYRLQRYLIGAIPNLNFRGVMSYYPVVTDEEQLGQLDGWLIHTLKQSLVLRQNLWQTHAGTTLPGPVLNWINQITNFKRWNAPDGRVYDLQIPSFVLINRAMQLAIKKKGLSGVANPKGTYY
jgi:RNA-directed DNA polymerase